MSNLKKENVSKCVSLLREFIDGADSRDNKKGIAVLALDQLERITAGTTNETDAACASIPRAIGEASYVETGSACASTPRAIG